MKKSPWKSIEAFLAGMFIIRLYGIWFPPLETWHSWRQTLTNMIARNMNEQGFTLLYPKIDMAGAKTGIIGSEFPLFQNLIALFNEIFGYEHWYGRLIALLTSTIATWCFFRIIRAIWNERTAWFSTVIFTTSLWFSFSRKTMPDTFAVSLVIIGFYFLLRYLSYKRFSSLIGGFIFLTLGGLCKIPAVYLFILVVPFFFNKRFHFPIRLRIAAVIGAASVIIASWYFIWVPYLVNTYGFQLYFPKGILEGLKEIQPYWSDFWGQIYFGALRSYIVLLPLIFGIGWLFVRNNRRYLPYFVLAFLVFFIFAIKTGTVFPTHNYYVLPLVPVLAVLAGLGLQRIDHRLALVLICLIAIEGVGNQISDFRVKEEVRYKLTLEKQLNELLPRRQKVVLPTGSNPEWMYWYHRKGWSLEPEAILNDSIRRQLITEGGQYLVVDKRVEPIAYPFEKFGENNACIVYKLK